MSTLKKPLTLEGAAAIATFIFMVACALVGGIWKLYLTQDEQGRDIAAIHIETTERRDESNRRNDKLTERFDRLEQHLGNIDQSLSAVEQHDRDMDLAFQRWLDAHPR